MAKTTPANALQSAIFNYLAPFEIAGKLMFWRQNSTGVWDERKQCYRKPKGLGHRNGISDIILILAPYGRFFGMEVKTTDKQSDAQSSFQRDIERVGGIYAEVRSLEEAKLALEAAFNQSLTAVKE